MSNALEPRCLEVWLHALHIGWLCEAGGATRFVATENFQADTNRPILSLSAASRNIGHLQASSQASRYIGADCCKRGKVDSRSGTGFVAWRVSRDGSAGGGY